MPFDLVGVGVAEGVVAMDGSGAAWVTSSPRTKPVMDSTVAATAVAASSALKVLVGSATTAG